MRDAEPSGGKRARYWCDAGEDVLRAPTEHLFVEHSLRSGKIRVNGSVYNCFC